MKMPLRYKKKARKRPARKMPYPRRRYRSIRPTRLMYITRESNRDTTNLCHFTISGSASGVINPLSTTFNFSDMVGAGEMQALFDHYSIKKVAYRFVLVRDADYTTVVPGAFVRIATCKDYNSQVALTAAQIRQYTNYHEIVFKGNQDKSKWFYMKPACLQLIYLSSTASSTGAMWNQWIDTSQTATPHYSLHYAIDNLYTGATLRLECKITVALKGVS